MSKISDKEIANPNVVIKYQTQKHYCTCCNQKLPNPEMSKVREFKISKEDALQWAPWHEAAEFPEDMESMVPDFVYGTIDFFATNSNEKIIIENSEIEKVREFILRVVISETSESQ
jgi:hypothetical protein